jgi:RES domain
VGEEPGGRFDLTLPNGTCYLAETEIGAASERCGRFLAYGMPVPPGMYEGRVVTEVPVPPTASDVADATAPAAAKHHQVTRELFSGDDYELTAQWAKALHDFGYSGIAYEPRFSTGSGRAFGLFGEAGSSSTDAITSSRWLVEVLRDNGIRHDALPALSQAQLDDEADVEDTPDEI